MSRESRRGLAFSSLVVILLLATQAWAGTSTATTFTVTSGGNPVTTVNQGTVVTLTATVKAGTTNVTPGQVKFCDASVTYCTDIHMLGLAQLTSSGTATMKFVPGPGNHSYKAVFVGTNTYTTSASSTSALTVNAGSVASGAFTSTFLEPATGAESAYTLTATVTGDVPTVGLFAPTGTVSFVDMTTGNTAFASTGLSGAVDGWRLQAGSQTPPTGTLPQGVAVADFNNDGHLDLAIANCTSNSVSIDLGNGDGTFTPVGSSPTVSGCPLVIAAADFNGDGIPDLAVASKNLKTITILFGNGDGTFGAPKTTNLAGTVAQIAVADLNGDGIPDLVLMVNPPSGLQSLVGNGDGTFQTPVYANSGDQGNFYPGIALGDFNKDGKIDLVANCGLIVCFLAGNGDGTFVAAISSGGVMPHTGVTQLVAADFNGDGNLDVVTNNVNDLGSGHTYSALLLGDGTGHFTNAPAPFPTLTNAVAVGDFSGDGIPDLVYLQSATTLWLLTGKGDGTFTTAPTGMRIPDATVASLATGDFNGDGISDLAASNAASYAQSVAIELGQPTVTATATATGVAAPGVGAQTVFASYPGDSNFAGSASPDTISLVGSAPVASFSCGSTTGCTYSFNSPAPGVSSLGVSVVVTNAGGSALNISSIKLGGANANAFATSNTCPSSLAINATCQIGIRFVPPATGTFNATITLIDNAPNSPQVISISGNCTTPPVTTISLSATLELFGTETVGVSTGAQNFFVTNSGTQPLYFGYKTIVLTGPNASSFVTSNTCGGNAGITLTPGQSCRVGVRMVPQTTGPLTAYIQLTDNATGSPQLVTLKGTGQ